jgi:hypothetical protein
MKSAGLYLVVLGLLVATLALAPVILAGKPGFLYYPAAGVGGAVVLVGVVLWFFGRRS